MKEKNSKVIVIYNIIIFLICYILGFLELLTHSGKFYKFLGIFFTFIPVITALLTKKITNEKSKYSLSLKVWENKKYWILSAILPGILVTLGVILYYLVFPDNYSGIFKIGLLIGKNAEIIIKYPFLLLIFCVIISAIMIPIQLLELGEETGWRGYLLGFQVEKYGERKASIINGIEWGLVHLPLIYFGFNYSLQNFGAPWTNMIMMLITCIVLGIIFSFVTIKTGNYMYAAIIHGVINVIGELPVYCSNDLINGLLGPNPSGLLTLLPLIFIAVICYSKLNNVRTEIIKK